MLNFIHNNAMLISGLILVIAYVFIASEKIQKSVVALAGASLTMLLGLIPFETHFDKETHTLIKGVFAHVDFQVIFLLIGMMIIVHIASRSGVFKWLALELLHLTKGHPKTVLFALAAFTAIASAFLDNVTTVVLMMPITFIIAKEFDTDPVPFLITEVLASNIGGTATLIGDPPNIIIGTRAGLSFMDFVNELTPIITLIFLISVSVLIFLFRKGLKATPEVMQKIATIDNSQTITDKKLMIRSVVTILLVILGFVTHDVTHIQTCVAAMLGASVLLLFEKPSEILRDVEWNTIFFFIGLFIIIGGVEASGGIRIMAEWILKVTQGSQEAASMLILWASGVISGVIDNIPYTATMAPMLSVIKKSTSAEYAFPLWWCLSLGACLGGNLTIIGAAANVIVSENAAAEGHPIAFMRFLKYGITVVVISLLLCTAYIKLMYL